MIKFCKTGSKQKPTQRTRSTHLTKSNDWHMRGELGKTIKIHRRNYRNITKTRYIIFFQIKKENVNYVRINHPLGREYFIGT